MRGYVQPGCQLALILMAISGCGARDQQAQRAGLTRVYRCTDQQRFVVRFEPQRAWIFIGDRTVSVPRLPAASGTHYTAGDVTFRERGPEASLRIGSMRHDACVLLPSEAPWEEARLRGVDFRAVGHHPAWTLEIREGEDAVFSDDGNRNPAPYSRPHRVPGSAAQVYEFSGRDGPFRVTLDTTAGCGDPTADEQLTTKVLVEWSGRLVTGCGRLLRSNP